MLSIHWLPALLSVTSNPHLVPTISLRRRPGTSMFETLLGPALCTSPLGWLYLVYSPSVKSSLDHWLIFYSCFGNHKCHGAWFTMLL